MRLVSIQTIVFVLVTGFASIAHPQTPGGAWTLRITNPNNAEVVSMTIRFTDDRAPSCMAGNWKRVVVEATRTKDESFFPVADPLSYKIEGSELTIGRNEICDGYLHLRGRFVGERAEGSYVAFGINSGKSLGEFSLRRD